MCHCDVMCLNFRTVVDGPESVHLCHGVMRRVDASGLETADLSKQACRRDDGSTNW